MVRWRDEYLEFVGNLHGQLMFGIDLDCDGQAQRESVITKYIGRA